MKHLGRNYFKKKYFEKKKKKTADDKNCGLSEFESSSMSYSLKTSSEGSGETVQSPLNLGFLTVSLNDPVGLWACLWV